MSVSKWDCLLRLQTLLVFLILNDTAKTKLAALSFLECGEILKNSTDNLEDILTGNHQYEKIRFCLSSTLH